MKTLFIARPRSARILILILFVSIMLHFGCNVQADSKTTSRMIKWQTAVQTDVPVFSVEKKSLARAATSSLRAYSPAFYSMKEDLPPFPVNPFPDTDVFALGGNKFAYDDRAVDYSRRIETKMVNSKLSRRLTPSTPFFASLLDSQTNLSVNMSGTNASGFLLDVFNTVQGNLYGIGAKSVVDSDPFNTWTLLTVFEAPSTNTQLVGTVSAQKRFYTAVNLNEYVGPVVNIVSPISGTVSGAADLQVRVTDVLPLTSLKVYVDGVQAGVITLGQNGTATLPTYLFPNGEHQIWVEAVNAGLLSDTDGDSVGDEIVPFVGGASVTLNFTNDVYLENYSPLYSALGSFTLQYAVTVPQNYIFKVFDLNGNLLHTNIGQSISGIIDAQWDFTDLTNNPVNDSGYVFSLMATPQGGGPSKTVVTTNFFDHGVTVGKYVVSYGTWPYSSINNGLVSLNASVSARVNSAAYYNDDVVGSGREDYNTIHVDFTSDPFPIRQATQTNDLAALTNALANSLVGSWFFDGHSGQNNLIHDGDPNNPYLTIDLTSKQVAALLGNSYGFIPGGAFFSVSYGRRLFSTFITGCSAAISSSEWPDATGAPIGVDQVANVQIKKSAFLGFTALSSSGSTKFNWINRIHVEWLDESDYDTPLYLAMYIANSTYSGVLNWGPTIIGYGPLEYNGGDSR